jgi:AcrR family transcriptional regulator
MIDAGLELIEKEGATALSLRAVARRVGVSTAAPYRHFPSREALLAAVAEEGYRLLGHEIRRAIAAHDNPARRLGESGIAYVLFAVAHPSRYGVMFLDYQEAGWMSSRDPGELALSAWSSVHGLASLITGGHIRVEGSDPPRIEETARAVVRSLVPGFDG